MLNFIENCHVYFQSRCTSLNSCQHCFTSSPAWIMIGVFDLFHSDRCMMDSQSHFDVHFPNTKGAGHFFKYFAAIWDSFVEISLLDGCFLSWFLFLLWSSGSFGLWMSLGSQPVLRAGWHGWPLVQRGACLLGFRRWPCFCFSGSWPGFWWGEELLPMVWPMIWWWGEQRQLESCWARAGSVG